MKFKCVIIIAGLYIRADWNTNTLCLLNNRSQSLIFQAIEKVLALVGKRWENKN